MVAARGSPTSAADPALTDAAQPLDDLEEHRRNVSELGRTASALVAVQEV